MTKGRLAYPDSEWIAFCDLCKGEDFHPVGVCREPEGAAVAEMRGCREFAIVQCDGCGLRMVAPRYDRAKLKRLYGREYFTGSGDHAQARAAYWAKDNRLADMRFEADFLKRRFAAGKILDAGCGTGCFADALGREWKVYGIEWSEYAAEYARKKSMCVDTSAGDLESVDLGGMMFDGLVMNQVIDHLRRPATVLNRLAEHVRPGGFVLLGKVVNAASVTARVFKDDFRLLAPNHLFYFSPSTLRRLLRDAGFERVEIAYPFFKTPHYSRQWWRQAFRAYAGRLFGETVASPPAPGNIMTAFARKRH